VEKWISRTNPRVIIFYLDFVQDTLLAPFVDMIHDVSGSGLVEINKNFYTNVMTNH